ncbi:MAG: DUF2080 family transposase-associated protein [Pseudomonadota bacterium]
MTIDDEKRDRSDQDPSGAKVKFEIFGQELIQKTVKASGNTGRIYLPPEWIGAMVKVVKC